MCRMNPIKRVRKDILGINQNELAEAAGVTQPTVSRWEKGKQSPSVVEIERVCARYRNKVKAADFFSKSAQ